MSSIAKKYLEELQERIYSSQGVSHKKVDDFHNSLNQMGDEIFKNPDKYPFMNSEQYKDHLTKDVEDAYNSMRNHLLPTKFEDPLQYPIIATLAADIEKAIPEISFTSGTNIESILNGPFNLKFPVLGTLPTGEINARAIFVPSSDEYLVVFDSELVTFCHKLSKIIARALPCSTADNSTQLSISGEEHDILSNIDQNSEIIDRFKEFIFACIFNKRPSTVKPYFIEYPYNTVSNVIVLALEYFVLGHEYAHVLFDHPKKSQKINKNIQNQKIKTIQYSHRSELEADNLGLALMFNTMKKRKFNISMSYIGAELFFSCQDIIANGRELVHNNHESSNQSSELSDDSTNSHPSSKTRRNELRRITSLQYGKKSIQFGFAIEKLMNILWDRVKYDLVTK